MVLQSFLATADSGATASLLGALTLSLVPLLWKLLLSPRRKQPLPATSDSDDNVIRLPHVLPSTLPVLGNLMDHIRHDACRPDWFTTLGETYHGEAVSLAIPGQALVVSVFTPQAAEDILKTQFDKFPKGDFQGDALREFLGHGVFAVDGAAWVHQRKAASHLFTARALREKTSESVHRYTATLLRLLEDASEAGTAIDVFQLMNRFTMDAFTNIGFGIEMHCLDGGQEHPFQAAFDAAERIVVKRFQRPVWFWKLQRFLNVGYEAELKTHLAVVDRTVAEMVSKIVERCSQGDREADQTKDLVTIFLSGADRNGEIDATFIRDITVNFLLAGRDTTAQALTWLFYNLSRQPTVATRIRDEIRAVLPGLLDGSCVAPSKADLQRLTYLEATVKETLRLHPSVPIIPKSCAEDTVLSDGTFIAKGSTVLIPAYAMGRLEMIWGSDAKAFKPERWIDAATGKIRQESAFKFVAFNAGPRQCLGMHLALLEMKIVVARVLSLFSIELLPGQQITYDNSITLAVKGEMLAQVKPAPTM